MPSTDSSEEWHEDEGPLAAPADFEALLKALSDDELRAYGALADDQWGREAELWWGQAIAAVGALAGLLWASQRGFSRGFDGSVILALLFSCALGYWPWRKARTRALWEAHRNAVADEVARRQGRTGSSAANEGPTGPEGGSERDETGAQKPGATGTHGPV